MKFRLKISRKEAKESKYWLRLLADLNDDFALEIKALVDETEELRKIFSAIIYKV